MAASIYCLIPEDLADELLEPLRAHYARDPRVEVIVERRDGERRSGSDRRAFTFTKQENDPQRSGHDRREKADRRAVQIPRKVGPLPSEASAHADRIRWAQRLAPVSRGMENLQVETLIAQTLDGEPGAATELYWRKFERVYTHLRMRLKLFTVPEKHTREAFGILLDRLPEWEDGDVPFDEWLMHVVDDYAEQHHGAETNATLRRSAADFRWTKD